MGNSQKNTYIAPDGTVYRIEPDGRMVKIKDPKSKASASGSGRYQVSDDGQIFRIEDDGSVTNLGNIEQRPDTPPRLAPRASNVPPTIPPHYITNAGEEKGQKSNRGWIWLIVLGVIALIAILTMLAYNCSGNNDYYEEEAAATAEVSFEDEQAMQTATEDEYLYDQAAAVDYAATVAETQAAAVEPDSTGNAFDEMASEYNAALEQAANELNNGYGESAAAAAMKAGSDAAAAAMRAASDAAAEAMKKAMGF